MSLFTWPAHARERDGNALVRAFEDGWGKHVGRVRRIMTTLSECGAVLTTGLGMRGRALQSAMRGTTLGWVGDLRYSLRTLLRSPGFTLTVTLTLAVGIGANAAVFGLVDRVLFDPPPYEDPSSLLFVWHTLGRSPDRFRVPAPDVAEFRERAELIDAFAFVTRPSDAAIESPDGGGAEHVRLAAVTVDLFDVLGVVPLLGTTFAAEDSAPLASDPTAVAAPGVIILSHAAWQRAFAGDPDVVGQTVRMNGRPARVVGVMASDFRLPMPPDVGMGAPIDVWTPLVLPLGDFQRAAGRQVDQDSDNTGAVIARLRQDVTIEQASAEMIRIAADLRARIESYATSHVDVVVRPMHADVTAHLRGMLAALLLGVGGVLLATCLNVSTLLLARGARRHRELAVRAALGATHPRIVRQLLTESLVLVGLGSVLSLLVASVVSGVLSGWVPPELEGAGVAGFDPTMLALAVLLTAGATVVFGLVPALRLTETGKGGPGGVGMLRGPAKHGRASAALVAGQVALSVVLALTTGLLLRTAQELQAVDPGFEPEGAMTFAVSLRTPGRYSGPSDRARLMREVETALAELPGVHAVGLSAHLPLGGRRWSQPYGLPGQPQSEWAGNRADFRTITSGYFEALGADLLEGRSFSRDEDLSEERRVVVVDDRLARRLAPSGQAVGATIGFPLDGSIVYARVVGVVGHVRHESLETDGRETLFVPYRQEASRDVSFVVRTDGDPPALAPAIRRIVHAVDEQLPVYGLRTLSSYVDAAVAPTQFAMAVLGIFAFLVLLSVTVGLHGVISLEVSTRRREIGVRVAMGAKRWTVVRSILWQGLRLATIGTLLGVAIALALSRVLNAFVFGSSIADPITWAGVLGTVFTVTMLACWLPALRASRLDPTEALRAD